MGKDFSNIDVNSALKFYDYAYDIFKINKNVNEHVVFELFQKISLANYSLKRYDLALNYDLECLLYFNNEFYINETKLRIVETHFKLENNDLAFKFIEELNIQFNKLNKNEDSYLIYNVNLIDILLENNQYEIAIPYIKELISVFSKKNNKYDLNSYQFYLAKCYFFIGQIENAKQIMNRININDIYPELIEDFSDLKNKIN